MNKKIQRKNISIEIESKQPGSKKPILWVASILLTLVVAGAIIFVFGGKNAAETAVAGDNTSETIGAEGTPPAVTGEPAAAQPQFTDPWETASRPPPPSRLTIHASNSWAILPNGPRSGEGSDLYLNVQGRGMNRFSSIGVIEFPLRLPNELRGMSVLPRRGVLQLAQSVAQFSRPGRYSVWLVTGQFDINTINRMRFDPAAGVGGIDPVAGDLGELVRLHNQQYFTPATTGRLDPVTLEINTLAGRLLSEALKNEKPVFLLLLAEDADVSATFAGVASTRADPPTLELFFD